MPSKKNAPSTKTYENMLFNFATTYRTDYRDGEIREPPKIEVKEKPVCLRPRPPPPKDIHTLTEWKSTVVPFSFFIKPKEIIRTDPSHVQLPYTKAIDLEREESQRTRPRLVMTPALSVDDIKDPEIRRILVEDMYTSDMTMASREAMSTYFRVKAPFPEKPAPSNPITLTKLQPPVVSPSWRKETVTWDRKQLRSYCDHTMEFWKRTVGGADIKCEKCIESRNVELHKKMKKLMQLNR